MTRSSELVCDGCGQAASAEHIARRLRRLEWTTRYRPVHINTLFLGSFSPRQDEDFLYAPSGEFRGEAALLLEALGISTAGKTRPKLLRRFVKLLSYRLILRGRNSLSPSVLGLVSILTMVRIPLPC